MKKMTSKEHTFVICAYKNSQYLEECIRSLVRQRDYSDILMVTSTPSDYITELANKYEIELFVNEGESGITQDWEYAISKSKTDIVTIAHQDDIYEIDYSKRVIDAIRSSSNPIIAFTDYYEIIEGEKIYKNKLLRIKRLMLSLFRLPLAEKSIFIRRLVLSLGNPICCPSVAYYLPNISRPLFNHHFRSNEDWEAWEKLSKENGDFIYINKMLMAHRIHNESETSIIIGDDSRSLEDYEMYRKFWPKCIARYLARKYKESEKYNNL